MVRESNQTATHDARGMTIKSLSMVLLFFVLAPYLGNSRLAKFVTIRSWLVCRLNDWLAGSLADCHAPQKMKTTSERASERPEADHQHPNERMTMAVEAGDSLEKRISQNE